MPRSRYPKPLIFHDGRLAFLPTPAATVRMFTWLPIGIPIAILRLFVGSVFPCSLIIPLCAATGMDLRVSGPTRPANGNNKGKGVLYVCNHRVLFDPTFLAGALRKPLTAVTYGLSRTTEIISPIKTVRLTRDRQRDRDTMQRLLAEGDLGDHVQGAVPAPVQLPFRGARGRDRAGGGRHRGEHVLQDDDDRSKVVGPGFVPSESETGLQYPDSRHGTRAANVRRGGDEPRGGELYTKGVGGGVRVRVHQSHEKG